MDFFKYKYFTVILFIKAIKSAIIEILQILGHIQDWFFFKQTIIKGVAFLINNLEKTDGKAFVFVVEKIIPKVKLRKLVFRTVFI